MGRPLSGKTEPKGRPSFIDRFSPGGKYEPVSEAQFANVTAPVENNNVNAGSPAVADEDDSKLIAAARAQAEAKRQHKVKIAADMEAARKKAIADLKANKNK